MVLIVAAVTVDGDEEGASDPVLSQLQQDTFVDLCVFFFYLISNVDGAGALLLYLNYPHSSRPSAARRQLHSRVAALVSNTSARADSDNNVIAQPCSPESKINFVSRGKPAILSGAALMESYLWQTMPAKHAVWRMRDLHCDCVLIQVLNGRAHFSHLQ